MLINISKTKNRNEIQTPIIKIEDPSISRWKKLEPREFCRLMFGLNSFSESEIIKIEETYEYTQASRLILMEILGVSWKQVTNWGKFQSKKVPECHKKTLGLYWELHKTQKIKNFPIAS